MKAKNLFKKGRDYEEIEHPYFKYRLLRGFSQQTYVTGYKVMSRHFTLEPCGKITVFKGFMSDGASGFTIDTRSSMRGAFSHDCFYKALRDMIFFDGREWCEDEHNEIRQLADKTAKQTWKSDGMLWIRYSCWYRGLRIGGSSSSVPDFTRHKYKGKE